MVKSAAQKREKMLVRRNFMNKLLKLYGVGWKLGLHDDLNDLDRTYAASSYESYSFGVFHLQCKLVLQRGLAEYFFEKVEFGHTW